MADAKAVKSFLVLCMALAAATGCGSSSPPSGAPPTPLSPTPVMPVRSPLTGAWTGMFEVSSCTGHAEWCRTTHAEPFSLNLDTTLSGFAEVEMWSEQSLALEITQSTATDGSTILKGLSTVTKPQMDLEIQLQGSESSGLSGSVRYTISGPLYGTSAVATRTGPILFIRPVTTVRAGALQGTWRGYLNPTACSGDCQHVDQTVSFSISQQGSRLLLHWSYTDEIEGTASGQEFTFTREWTNSNCPTSPQQTTGCQEFLDFRGSVDSLGRMRGTIKRREVGVDYFHDPFSYTATLDLESVVRVTPSVGGH